MRLSNFYYICTELFITLDLKPEHLSSAVMANVRFIAVLAFVLLFACIEAKAQDVDLSSGNPEVNIKIDTRFDGQLNTFGHDADGNRPSTEKGFKGSYLMLLMDGRITEKFSYNFRYRLYKDNNTPSEFFNATDWLYLQYSPNDKWSFVAGKQAVAIGTMEYDLNPIDVFFASDFWNNTNPWQIGVAAHYSVNPSNTLNLQISNSPFSTKTLDNLMSYNFMWSGKVADWWQVANSVNMIEYAEGRYINYVALGNRLNIYDKVELELDYVNRYGGRSTPVFADFTVIANADWNVNNRVTLFAKAGYDQNHSQAADTPEDRIVDRTVLPGVERTVYGCGIKYYPIVTRRNTVRLHALWNSSSDTPRCHTFLVGLRWQMDLLRLKFKNI